MYGQLNTCAASCIHDDGQFSFELSSLTGSPSSGAPSPDSQNNNNVSLQNNNSSSIQMMCHKFSKTNDDSENGVKLTREERRKRRRATQKYRSAHASRERVRVGAFNVAFRELRQLLPTLPPNKKLSKIEILRMAICYISYLSHILDMNNEQSYLAY